MGACASILILLVPNPNYWLIGPDSALWPRPV